MEHIRAFGSLKAFSQSVIQFTRFEAFILVRSVSGVATGKTRDIFRVVSRQPKEGTDLFCLYAGL